MSGQSAVAAVMDGVGPASALAAEMAQLEAAMVDPDRAAEMDALVERYGEVQHRFEMLGGYGVEAEGRRVLHGLGFTDADSDRPVQDLSGGWRMRVALARLMLSAPDLLVLDEPTNHLDVESVAWLEQYLQDWPGAILFVSHDRDFLDAVAERVVEVAQGRAIEYVGGFAEFVIQREERHQAAIAAAEQQQRQIEAGAHAIDQYSARQLR